MDLRFNTSLAEGYKSASQIARVLTEDWLNIRLEEIVKEQITSNMSSDYGEKKVRLDEKVNSMRQEGYTTSEIDNDRIVKKLRGELEVMGDAEEMQAEAFSHLNTFFSRYYDKGDFVTLRRYKKDFRRMIKTTPSGFRLQTSDFIFALQSLQLTVLQFLKTIFLRYS